MAAAEPAHALSAPADETELEVRPHAPRDAPTVYAGRERGEPAIEGVEHVRLSPHVDHRGSLTEVVNVTHPFWQEPVVHAYRISIRPGRIKGWGMHKLQADRYLVESGTVRIVLYDGRVDSPTFERYEVHSFDDITAGLLRIPPGVWHADQNTGETDVFILNFPTRAFDPAHPDKYRIDPHSGEIPFDWTLRDG